MDFHKIQWGWCMLEMILRIREGAQDVAISGSASYISWGWCLRDEGTPLSLSFKEPISCVQHGRAVSQWWVGRANFITTENVATKTQKDYGNFIGESSPFMAEEFRWVNYSNLPRRVIESEWDWMMSFEIDETWWETSGLSKESSNVRKFGHPKPMGFQQGWLINKRCTQKFINHGVQRFSIAKKIWASGGWLIRLIKPNLTLHPNNQSKSSKVLFWHRPPTSFWHWCLRSLAYVIGDWNRTAAPTLSMVGMWRARLFVRASHWGVGTWCFTCRKF